MITSKFNYKSKLNAGNDISHKILTFKKRTFLPIEIVGWDLFSSSEYLLSKKCVCRSGASTAVVGVAGTKPLKVMEIQTKPL